MPGAKAPGCKRATSRPLECWSVSHILRAFKAIVPTENSVRPMAADVILAVEDLYPSAAELEVL
jgi:hypothetical protein